jgi:hypothetical protein
MKINKIYRKSRETCIARSFYLANNKAIKLFSEIVKSLKIDIFIEKLNRGLKNYGKR